MRQQTCLSVYSHLLIIMAITAYLCVIFCHIYVWEIHRYI